MLTKDEFAELSEIRAQGMLARAFAVRREMPTDWQWKLLRGTEEITMRDIGNIAFELEYEIGFVAGPIEQLIEPASDDD